MTDAVPPRRAIEVLRLGSKIGVTLVTLFLLAVGSVVVVAVFRQADLSVGERVIGGVVGVGFAGMGLLFLIDLPGMLARHQLVFDHEGLAYRVTISRVKSFRVSWSELDAVSVSTATRQARASRSTFVRLDMTPTDPDAFARRHPEMATLRGSAGAAEDVWRLPFGPNGYDLEPISQALHDYAGPRDRGVDDDGRASGRTYR